MLLQAQAHEGSRRSSQAPHSGQAVRSPHVCVIPACKERRSCKRMSWFGYAGIWLCAPSATHFYEKATQDLSDGLLWMLWMMGVRRHPRSGLQQILYSWCTALLHRDRFMAVCTSDFSDSPRCSVCSWGHLWPGRRRRWGWQAGCGCYCAISGTRWTIGLEVHITWLSVAHAIMSLTTIHNNPPLWDDESNSMMSMNTHCRDVAFLQGAAQGVALHEFKALPSMQREEFIWRRQSGKNNGRRSDLEDTHTDHDGIELKGGLHIWRAESEEFFWTRGNKRN